MKRLCLFLFVFIFTLSGCKTEDFQPADTAKFSPTQVVEEYFRRFDECEYTSQYYDMSDILDDESTQAHNLIVYIRRIVKLHQLRNFKSVDNEDRCKVEFVFNEEQYNADGTVTVPVNITQTTPSVVNGKIIATPGHIFLGNNRFFLKSVEGRWKIVGFEADSALAGELEAVFSSTIRREYDEKEVIETYNKYFKNQTS